jgi:hypothetical protein
MFDLLCLCTSHKCRRHEFRVRRGSVRRKSTSDQEYTVSRVVCPQCRMWADVQEIKEVKG